MSVYKGKVEGFYDADFIWLTPGDAKKVARFKRNARLGQLKAQRTRKHNKGDHSTCVKSECEVARAAIAAKK